MNYSENNKTYGRKVIRKNKRNQFVAWCVVLWIVFSVVTVVISGIVHLFVCTNMMKANASSENVVAPITETIEEPETINLGEYKLTAYCACAKCCGKTDGITASGAKAVEGVTVAADPKVIPMGTEIIIDGHEYIVQDTGGAIKGNRIDVYFDSHQDALEFGVQYKNIYTMKEGETSGQV